MVIRTKRYTWRNGALETPGAQIRHSGGGRVFVPLEDLVRVSDELIDIVEQHENRSEVRRPTDTNDAFDELADR